MKKHLKVSISSTFYTQIFCTKVCSKPNSKQIKAAQKTFVWKIWAYNVDEIDTRDLCRFLFNCTMQFIIVGNFSTLIKLHSYHCLSRCLRIGVISLILNLLKNILNIKASKMTKIWRHISKSWKFAARD